MGNASSALSNAIRLGTVAEVNLATARCRVQVGEMLTDYLPWVVTLAGTTIIWSAPSIGEQVVVLSPAGDLADGLVLRGLYSDQFAAPAASDTLHVLRFADGAQIHYDTDAHALQATLPSGGTASITADGGITLNGPLTVNGTTQINGDATITGTATATTDVLGGGISLKHHKTTGVTAGSALSGGPQ
ncbi:phage baseplate assembly protein V [Xanthomonas fragariae]|uniref:Phage-related baseplate assembly protein n=1 Tax=Xanthomonas fragariae TaxID=48664 RepID=A0A1Y6HI21_9XANT|nr:phage baseplate assembly protein V [Xanthomonas fragariae]AOD13552.1 baseplate assembly protein [Xanthomonas fragariae]AOD16939.1 baseplate assembly protein [Xanthomonas fragariae]ENZ95226.1 phage-related baseplate protein [Xanthomonas fragariae LMG 25863]MBL9198126.1 phage baseplate assembly protein V [Xanthomonas fragariae]MBL9222398.1 phage baseplate assembly protein V [Xanthomonas fragariae]